MGAAKLANLVAARKSLSYVRHLARFLKQHEIEIIHTNSLKAAVLGGLAGRLARCKVVWHIRDRIAADYLPAKAASLIRFLARLLPHLIIGNSHATLRTLNLRRTKSAVVPSGVDLATFDVGGPRSEKDWAVGDAVRIGLIGRICPWKGQHIFIEAAAKVHATNPNSRFLIVGAALFGEHAYELELRDLVRTHGLEEVIEFTGFQRDIASVIHSLDILVHASVLGEPFGQVIVQGMAAGKPVVATNGGGVPESVVDGETGMLVPMGDADAMADAINKLLADPESARAMGKRGRIRVEQHFTIEQSARKVTEIYEGMARK